jgi:Ca2+-binding EF-hand superfamily protein
MMGMTGVSAFGGGRMPDLSAMRDKLFAKGDADQSGGLSQAEFTELSKSMPGGAGSNASELFSSIDSSGDGSIDKDEMSRVGEKMRDNMQSIMLSVQMQFGGSQGVDPTKLFEQADSDSDGSITKTEFSDTIRQKGGADDSDAIEKLFEALDADKSGGVSKSEVEEFQKKIADAMKNGGSGEASGSDGLMEALKKAIDSYGSTMRSADPTQTLLSMLGDKKAA